MTHRKVFDNHEQIKTIGLNKFIIAQKQRIEMLEYLIDNFDNDRSKSFFCQTCTLLPLENLSEIHRESKLIDDSLPTKERNQAIKGMIQKISDRLDIDLKLRKK